MPKYRVWTHIDTGIEQVIEAKDEDEAIEIAESNIGSGFVEDEEEQLYRNMQPDETWVVEEL